MPKTSCDSPLTRLPAELCAYIVSYLPNRDRKSLRLTSRTLRDRTPLRIDRVFLSANARNVDVFRAIADHETLCQGVTEIIWDDACLAESIRHYDDESYSEIKGLTDYEECPAWFARACNENLEQLIHRTTDIPHYTHSIKQMEAQLPLEVSYAYYKGLLMQQQSVLETQADVAALRYGITHFPALKRVTITPVAHGFLYLPLYQTPMIRDFPYGFNYPIPRAWPTVEPGCSPYRAPLWNSNDAEKGRWRGFRIILQALAEQKHQISEFVMETKGLCTGLNCHVFDEPYEEYQQLVTLLQKPDFSRLDLALLMSAQQDDGWPSLRSGHLKRALSEARNIQHLSVCTDLGADQEFDISDDGSNEISLRTVFPIERWQKLRHFGLLGFPVRQDDLISLLAAMPISLQSIELSFLAFYGNGNYRDLLCDMRDKLNWRSRPANERPKVVIRGENMAHPTIGRAVWIENEISDFLYTDGPNPFSCQGYGNEIQMGFGVRRDEFDPAFERPYIDDGELERLGYIKFC
jgi:hypothetical protein